MEGIKMTTQKQMKLNERNDAVSRLHELLVPGTEICTILNHVSRSGMMRHISLVIAKDSEIIDITWLAARALDMKRADNGGIKIGGCGSDMGFELVYNLGSVMWPNGTKAPHGSRNGQPDYAGGYALKHRWL